MQFQEGLMNNEEPYQELINIYEENPNYKIEVDELRNNLINVSSVIPSVNDEIAGILDIIRAKNELCLYNFDDLNMGRISQEIFMDRVSEDLKSSEKLIKQALNGIKGNKLATNLLTLLSHREWNLTEDSSVKCLIGDCKECIENWDENETLRKMEGNQSMDYCFNKCLWCNRQRKDRKSGLNNRIRSSENNLNDIRAKTLANSQSEPTQDNKVNDMPDQIVTLPSNERMKITYPIKSNMSDKVYLQIGPVTAVTISEHQTTQILDSTTQINDKYFFVQLTAAREDGPDDYVIEILIKNFKQMFPPSYNAIAYIYNIFLSEQGSDNQERVPVLYGLIRYDHRNKHNITVKSTHIKNEIKSILTGIKNTRYYTVTNLTKYIGKQFKTPRVLIIEKYKFITETGKAPTDPSKAIGNTLDEFLY